MGLLEENDIVGGYLVRYHYDNDKVHGSVFVPFGDLREVDKQVLSGFDYDGFTEYVSVTEVYYRRKDIESEST
jgi:hypothetical protein